MPEAKVIVLIRATDESHALRRLERSAELGQWWSEFLSLKN
jgi:thioester reductase-like protein